MKSILVIAHGSRRAAANEEVIEWVERLRERLTDWPVALGFLELAEPTMQAGLDQLLSGTCEEVLIMPYFLASGRHVTEDIPEFVAAQLVRYPDLTITVLPHIGTHDGVLETAKTLLMNAPT